MNEDLHHLMAAKPEVWLSLGWSPESNRVEAEPWSADPELIRTLAATIPDDALSVRIAPGVGFFPLTEASPRNGRAG